MSITTFIGSNNNIGKYVIMCMIKKSSRINQKEMQKSRKAKKRR